MNACAENKAFLTRAEWVDCAITLKKNGYSPLPVKLGTKTPDLPGWSDYCSKQLTDEQLEMASRRNPGISVALGFDGLLNLDIDTNDLKIQRIIAGICPPKPVVKLGQRGAGGFYRYCDGAPPLRHYADKDGNALLDVLGHGSHTLIPPTIHPETGNQFSWLSNRTLYDAPVWELPELTREQLDELDEALKPYMRECRAWSQEERAKFKPLPDGYELSGHTRKRYELYAAKALGERIKELSQTPSGSRNNFLFRDSCYLGKYVIRGLISEKSFMDGTLGACRANGLLKEDGMSACVATINKGLWYAREDQLPELEDRPKSAPDGKPGGNDAKGDAQEPREWPEPGEIDAPLRHVASFNADELLPESFRDFVTDAAGRMPCAEDYVAVALMVMAGTTLGARVAMKPKRKDDWVVVPNLWGVIVGDPSQKKSPAIVDATRPMLKLIAKDEQEFEEAKAGLTVTKFIRDAQKANIEDKVKKAVTGKDKSGNLEELTKELKEFIATDEPEPVKRRRKTNDATVEKLGEMLRDNNRGLLVLRDEVVGLLASWDKAGREGDREFFLEGWNGGGSFDTDRIGRGSISIPNLCLSVFGGMQPDKLTGYLEQASNALANDGMLQRFQMLVYPDPVPWEYRDAFPNKKARELVNDIFQQLDSFDPGEYGAEPANQFVKFPHFKFAQDAQQAYIDFSAELHRVIEAEENSLIKQHLAKYDKLFPALALVLHLIECASTGARGPVTKAATLMAANWCRYLETHARRCYGLIADEGLRAARELAKHLKGDDPSKTFDPENFTVRDIRQRQWRHLTNDDAISAALGWLEDEGWVRPKPEAPKRGRPTTRYELNPRIRNP